MATQNLKLLREILGRLWDYDRDAALPESFRELAQRADLAHRLNRWMQPSQILHVERAQCCRDSRPDPNNPFFHAWPNQRNPKLASKK